MKNYKMTMQYDGTRYDGWQKQGNTTETIQGKIEAVLVKMLDGQEVELHGSGRTDAGAHAAGQVANFHAETSKKPIEMKEYLNTYLPEDIRILKMETVNERFHSRLNTTGKKYVYRVLKKDSCNVFVRKYTATMDQDLDVEKMKMAAFYLIGEHDFRSFCSNKKMKKGTVRTIFAVSITETDEEVKFYFYGSGFLHNMVRILTGTLIEVGTGRRKPDEIAAILEKKDRAAAGETAPAKGLILVEVKY